MKIDVFPGWELSSARPGESKQRRILGSFFEVLVKGTPLRGSTFRDFCDFWMPKGLPKGELILGVAPLGAPLEPHSVFGVTFGAPSAPKVTLRWQN